MKKILILLFFCIRLCATDTFSLSEPSFVLSPSDHLRFGKFWNTIRSYSEDGTLSDEIQQRRREIKSIKDHWRPFIETVMKPENLLFYEVFESILKNGHITLVEEGMAGTYFLHDFNGIERFVIKPLDEGILCLNNRKHYASPLNNSSLHVREHIPLYKSCQTDALASAVAVLCQIPYVTPNTLMAIIENDSFYDLIETDKDKEKLCSIQLYLPHTVQLGDVVHFWLKHNWKGREMAETIDQEDFEDAMLFVWLCYDTDAHSGNFLLYSKNQSQYGIKKIDNTLCFPEKNKGLKNSLSHLPNADFKLSERAKQIISNVPLEAIKNKMHFFEMDACIEAFEERLTILQELIKNKSLAIKDIDLRLSCLEYSDGKELALSSLPQEELEELIEEKKDSPFQELFGTDS